MPNEIPLIDQRAQRGELEPQPQFVGGALSSAPLSDQRLTSQPDLGNTDDRTTRHVSENRGTRAGDERIITEDRNLTDAERLKSFQQNFAQAELPDIPPLPGYHLCWLTTNNPRDPIVGRIRLGYELLRAEEIPGMEYVTLKTGEYMGCIGVNEMIAAKLPMRLYQMYMQDAHHNRPMANSQSIYDNIEQMADSANEHRGRLDREAGFENLKSDQRPAKFDN